MIIVDGFSNGNPFIFMKDTENTKRGTRTLENATVWKKETLKTDYLNGIIEICKASEWYKNI